MAKRNNYMYIRLGRELGPAPPHKKRCATCKYHGRLFAVSRKSDVSHAIFCDYIGATGNRRPCPAAECTVYEPKVRKKNDTKTKYRSDRPFGGWNDIYKPGGRQEHSDG